MPTAPPLRSPDFRLYHSNSLEVLAGLLADELRSAAPGQPLLAPDTVLIPQVAMRRWLQATMAERHGIAANLAFLTPGEFVGHALAANAGPANLAGGGNDLDADNLHWHLYAALLDPSLRARPAMAQLAGYLDGDDGVPKEGMLQDGMLQDGMVKAWTLAGELATVFGKYQAWRRDWLLRWEGGADPDDPQAILWRAVASGRDHRARRIQGYLARFGGDAGVDAVPSLPAGLPPRLFAFATLNVSPDVLRVMASQARVGTLHFYLPTPTKEYWGDLQSLGAHLRAGTDPFSIGQAGDHCAENPLLRDWGAAGRDFMALLGSYEVVHPSGEIAAYADPETAPGRTLADGGLRDSLLRRMQGDLFHRRAAPSGALRPDVDARDPSLQFHACHTRLRELQVLHDRLHALLEDKRFDPPLQPREIAVLAPDIDPYVPYLDAVFGGSGRGEAGIRQAIPWAIADASPLAGEPLAAVFLRLLALPVSRFGLEEVLELLASPPLAEAAGLDGAAFERLRAWLHEAGARWGIDAAHRARMGAPEDDAYTWQFALDRLLLGHATDADALVEGDGARVAPWTDLEGSALDALDVLLRLLRVLARHQRLLGEAMPPSAWRERLLGLLRSVLPRPRIGGSGERAYERLCKLIDAFAEDAARAGYTAPVPGEIVRAHFAQVLGEADTRAPLLTGGVSFARMVPMRLLPFRAICLLGMNDGDFPRRDPAAGLNRLTAELGTERRRHGDRSTRDDDRYLFLQLFSSAQDVFHVSWIGADPRDGSAREPSAVVSELLAAAAAYHAPADADALVLRHALQPFSPAAFGSGDPRHFSYDARWHPAAGQLSGVRTTLAPWMRAGTSLPPPVEAETELSLESLRRFLLAPAEQFLRQRLGLRLPEVEAAGEDIEPLRAPGGGLERHRLQHAVFDALLAGERRDALLERLGAQALLPSGALGARALSDVLDEVAPYAEHFARWRGDTTALEPLPLEASIDGVRLHARLGGVWPAGFARVRFGAPNGASVLRNGLDWLLASAAGESRPMFEFHAEKGGNLGPHERGRIDPAQAKDALRTLMALRASGLREPLPFAPRSGWKYYSAATAERGIEDARKQWQGSNRTWGEGSGTACELALRARDPFAHRDALRAFVANTITVFSAVGSGIASIRHDAPELDEDAIANATLSRDEDEGE
ncbi:exodeoxyribonuclease V subunit gamma [Cognatiluteimonas telluris]|uniref:exodeoxyribonuclease V subunit gamma n=1 Tax=Cognatiluteimonas telluris TaxID=1104775 RepID=UPI00140DB867|nr:exodeoxyribonuclease V subunit gamma [Lysobacter telluris]